MPVKQRSNGQTSSRLILSFQKQDYKSLVRTNIMKLFKVGDRARIICVPDKYNDLLNEVVTVVPIGGIGYEEDDICVILDSKMMLYLKESQLTKVDI
jgi:hypothetical protein